MPDTFEIWAKLVLSVAALVVVLRARRCPSSSRSAGRGLAAIAVASLAAWCNFGLFHGGGGFLHRWELFHHALGAKYFSELGYDGLYVASYAAQHESEPGLPLPSHLRDLRTYRVMPVGDLMQHREEVVGRFTPQRWRTFVHDHGDFLDHSLLRDLNAMRADHGLNASPAWILVARLFVAHLPLCSVTLLLVALLDPLLLAVMFAAIFRTFGTRAGCLSLILFCLLYPARFGWTGGAFLRQDWLAASGLAICCLARGQSLAAGALLGYAAAVRLFPAAFLFGPLVALASARYPEARRDLGRLVAGFSLTMVIALTAGSAAGRGATAWTEFAKKIDLRARTWLTNDVGLGPVVLYDRATIRHELVDWPAPEPWHRWQLYMDWRRHEWRRLLTAAALAFVGLFALAACRSSPHAAAVYSLAVIFAAVSLPSYYEAMLLLVPLAGRATASTIALLAGNAAFYAVHLASPVFELRYGAVSWGLALFFLGWLAAAVLGARAAGRPAPSSAAAADAPPYSRGPRNLPPEEPA